MFLAVFLANIAAWLVASLVGLVFWALVVNSFNESLAAALDELDAALFPQSSNIPYVVPDHIPITIPQVSPKSSVQNSRSSYSPTAIQTNREMCQYWTNEASSDSTEKSKAYRDNACMRYRNSMKP
jgi:hypothetical protein